MENFEIAGGTITGKTHLGTPQVLKAKNNQDAFLYYNNDDIMVGVVCDGCGSTPAAEVGANIISRLVTTSIVDSSKMYESINDMLGAAYIYTGWQVHQMAQNMSLRNMPDDYYTVLNDYFLCTIVGFVITPAKTAIFHIGDGVYAINGEITSIEPFEDNAPPYLTYTLFPQDRLLRKHDSLTFTIVEKDTAEINSLMVGSDGVRDLANLEESEMPGLHQKIGSIEQFWTQNAYFENPDLIRRKLSVINKDYIKYDNEQERLMTYHGLLPDDTTMITVRRKPEPTEDETVD